MPHVTLIIEPRGPVISLAITVSAQRRAALVAANLPVPAPVTASLLVDTGASCTSLDTAIIAQLGILPTGNIPVATPSTGATPHMCNTYDIGMIITGNGPPKYLPALPAIENDYSAQPIDGLLGRDVLGLGHFSYIGYSQVSFLTIL